MNTQQHTYTILIASIVSMQAQMETSAKEKGDMFDIMVVDEAKIRLGEEGWKQRYYQVSHCSSPIVKLVHTFQHYVMLAGCLTTESPNCVANVCRVGLSNLYNLAYVRDCKQCSAHEAVHVSITRNT